MLTAVAVFLVISLLCGLLLGVAASRLRVSGNPVVERIDALLPQTQCAQCGYPGCRPYAEALAGGRADINQCPPGGDAVIRALADLLGRDPVPADTGYGLHKPQQVAFIREEDCIGCALCIQVCPVDAIVGSARHMHTVIADACTGCELCLAPCPVDCIDLHPLAGAPAGAPPAPRARAYPCIRCGDCATACPVDLRPQSLYAFIRGGEQRKARAADLFDCIECGRCERVCPSHIPLVDCYRQAKRELRAADQVQALAERSLQRYTAREQRLAEARREHEAQLRRQRERLGAADGDAKRQEIAAAVARARKRRAKRREPAGHH